MLGRSKDPPLVSNCGMLSESGPQGDDVDAILLVKDIESACARVPIASNKATASEIFSVIFFINIFCFMTNLSLSERLMFVRVCSLRLYFPKLTVNRKLIEKRQFFKMY